MFNPGLYLNLTNVIGQNILFVVTGLSWSTGISVIVVNALDYSIYVLQNVYE